MITGCMWLVTAIDNFRNAQLRDKNILFVHGYMYEDSQSLPIISFYLYIRDVTHEFIKHVQKHAILLC